MILKCLLTKTEWAFPWVGLPHYVEAHGYQPPQEFIDAVMSGTLEPGSFMQTKGMGDRRESIGYLIWPQIQTGSVPEGFLEKLQLLVEKAEKQQYLGSGSAFSQTRG